MVKDEVPVTLVQSVSSSSMTPVQPAQAAEQPRLAVAVFTRFYPSVGGVESLAEVLAREWVSAGHCVTIVTDVAQRPDDDRQFPFPVLHRPKWREVIRLVRRSDIVLHNNISLKAIWPLLLVRRPLVASHQSWYDVRNWKEWTKRTIARRWAHCISASCAIQRRLRCDGIVIPNPYDAQRFVDQQRPRGKDLAFVGRLVSDKGVAVLLAALGELKSRGLSPSLTIVGDGPERMNIDNQIQQLGLVEQVAVVGSRNQEQVASILNEHRILVVPSVWDEPFGIVALEGAACGCVVVGSQGGGLPEAIGPCGLTFPNGDHQRLAAVLAELLRHPDRWESFQQAAPAHLAMHRSEVVAQHYIDSFHRILNRSTS